MPSPYTITADVGAFPWAIADTITRSSIGGIGPAAQSFPLGGVAAGLLAPSPSGVMSAEGSSFPLSIADIVTVSTSGGVQADAGAFPLSGRDVVFGPLLIAAEPGSFPLAGAASLRSFEMPAAVGAIPAPGKALALRQIVHILHALSGALPVSGKSAALTGGSPSIPALSRAFPLVGQDAQLRYRFHTIFADPGAFPATGPDTAIVASIPPPVIARISLRQIKPARPDYHVRHTGDDYGEAMLDLLPQGQAWPRQPEVALSKTVFGLCQIFGVVDGRAGDLLEIETDPRLTTEMLPDWERNFGLPDICRPLPPTTEDGRRSALVARMTLLGDQSRAFFLAQAEELGETVTIKEYAPYMCGYSRVGYTKGYYDGVQYRWELGPPEMRMAWTVAINHVLTGVECTFRRYKPAHTELIFRYTSAIDRAASLYVFLGV